MKFFFLWSLFFYFPFVLGQNVPPVEQKAFRVEKEKDLVVILQQPDLKKGMRILFVRKDLDLDELETIAQGIVSSSNKKFSSIKLDTENLKKIPTQGDFAVRLSEPKKFELTKNQNKKFVFPIEDNKPENDEEGYFDFGFINLNGSLLGASTSQVNSYKKLQNYNYSGIRLEWFINFFPNFGLSYESISGSVKVRSYYLNDEASGFDTSSFRLTYRSRKSPANWRWAFFAESSTESFTTGNPDEYVISSQYRLFQPGFHVDWEPGEQFPTKTSYWGSPYRLFFEFAYAPQVIAQDLKVSRGTSSSGSSRMMYLLGYTHQFYWSFIPWVDRYFIELKHKVSNLNLKFQGATQSETNGLYVIPESSSSTENQTNWVITFGVRFHDVFGKTFESRN